MSDDGGSGATSGVAALLSDEEEELSSSAAAPSASSAVGGITMQGSLCKWTNYLHGWQPRYFLLANQTLSYYKSENDTSFGCRGAVSIQKAACKPHEFDECRFDMAVVNGDIWYLRASDVETRNRWLEAIESHKNAADSAYGSDQSLKRHGSSMSIGSTMSQGSIGSRRSLIKEKLNEMDTFKDILSRQVDTIQAVYESLAAVVSEFPSVVSSVDVRGEAMTFKATGQALLAACAQCVELVSQHEDIWRRKLEREVERRKRAEAALPVGGGMVAGAQIGGLDASSAGPAGGTGMTSALGKRPSLININCPDMVEGPHSLLNEEDFFDAVEAFIEQNDQEVEQKRQIRNKVRQLQNPEAAGAKAKDHPLSKEVSRDISRTGA
ncbi:collagen type IV alpha-3-binding protein-like [Tropilaelaps mercedesae]|uniref:Collagen type IV alpha-3-binding protein-like n=1 Tax=Tropilaelaps mercedesae TaxID=418985 RepID=A0A1V9XM49_9ACAR|nr:collagen type IV alpha-3-binding protein-like [Tropilaelaps mercedesae]